MLNAECWMELDNALAEPSSRPPEELDVMGWNGERGRFVLEETPLPQADIYLLNEMDVGMARTENAHTVRRLAERLGVQLFVRRRVSGADQGRACRARISGREQAGLSWQRHPRALPDPRATDAAPRRRCTMARPCAKAPRFALGARLSHRHQNRAATRCLHASRVRVSTIAARGTDAANLGALGEGRKRRPDDPRWRLEHMELRQARQEGSGAPGARS